MCRGCTGIYIDEGFFLIVGEQGHTFGYLGRLDFGNIVIFFLCNKGLYPEIVIIIVYILIRWEGVIWI